MPSEETCIYCEMPLKDHVKTEFKESGRFTCKVKAKINLKNWKWVYGKDESKCL